MKTIYIAALVCIILSCYFECASGQQGNPHLDKKIRSLISKMTLEEKIKMLHANDLFSSAGVERLGIPPLVSDDGPLGVREEVKLGWVSANLTTDSATFFPNGSALAATWNPALAYQYGVALGEETRARKKNVILAPAFNIARTPLCGRTYEYYSEDPVLNSKLAVSAVQGIQSRQVAACIKHYALNNQETDRFKINVELSERALQEIYLPAFKAAVQQGGAWTVMSAYNKFRGIYCSENKYLLQDILKDQWGFKGIVISDWGGTHSTIQAAQNGLDIEMGTDAPYEKYYFAAPLLEAVKNGQVSTAMIDEKVYRLLWVMYHTSLSAKQPAGKINTPAHSSAAYNIAKESIVLLKNKRNLLPLNASEIKSIAVIGDNAVRTFHNGGFGADVKARYEISGLQGLKNKLGAAVHLEFAQGYRANYKTTDSEEARLAANRPDPVLIRQAADAAGRASVAIVFIGGNREVESEGQDRKDIDLPFGQEQLVNAIIAANPNTIVVVAGGSPYNLAEVNKQSDAIIWSWYNGAEGGNALADVILGKVNPSGKLPFTFPAKLQDSPAHALATFPGNDLTVEYKEGVFVGYRWFDSKKIEPLYPFGFGLSYSTFVYSDMHISKQRFNQDEKISVWLNVKNTGKISGNEVVQLYISKEDSKVLRPEKELKGFAKVWIEAGKSKRVQLILNVKDLAYFDEKSMKWQVEDGKYKLLVCSSSKDIRQKAELFINN